MPRPSHLRSGEREESATSSARLQLRRGRLAATEREGAVENVEAREPDEIFETIIPPAGLPSRAVSPESD